MYQHPGFIELSDGRKLKLFSERIERLRTNLDFFKNIKFELEFHQGKELKANFSGVSQVAIKAFLLDFRMFIAKGEAINFYAIMNVIEKYRDLGLSHEVIGNLREARKCWSQLLEVKSSSPVGGIRLKIDNSNLVSEDNLDLWINGDYFHLDDKKSQLIKNIQATPFGPLAFFVFIDLVQRLSGILFWFDKEVINKISD